MTRVEVGCEAMSDGWTCSVEVVDDASRSRHTVRVHGGDLARLDPVAVDPTDLVRRSFDYLLRREPKESILSTFDLLLISRYFSGYEAEIRRV